MTSSISIAVVDDHPLFREGVIRSLSEIGGFDVVAQGSSCDDAIRIAREMRPDVLLIDLSMPGGGLNAIQPIIASNPAQRIVVLTVSEAADEVTAALNSGAKGFVLKGVGSRALAEILATVAAGESYVSPSLAARVLNNLGKPRSLPSDPAAALSAREAEVLELVAQGMSNKMIARRLDLQEKTVKHHVSRVLAKLSASNRTEAAMIYRNARTAAIGVSQSAGADSRGRSLPG